METRATHVAAAMVLGATGKSAQTLHGESRRTTWSKGFHMDVITQTTAEMNKTTNDDGTRRYSSIPDVEHIRELRANGREKYQAHREDPCMGCGLACNRGDECAEKWEWNRGSEHRQQR